MPALLWIFFVPAQYLQEHVAAFSVGCIHWLVVVWGAGGFLMSDGVVEGWFSSAFTSEDAVELHMAWSDSKCQQKLQKFSQF